MAVALRADGRVSGGGSGTGCVGERDGKTKVEAAPLRSRPPPFQLLVSFYFTLNLFRHRHFGDLHAVRDVQVLLGLIIVNVIIHS